MKIQSELNAIGGIAHRDLTKLLRDRVRLLASLVFPVIFIGALGGSLQANWGSATGYNLLVFIFTGVFGQTMFQSTASGIISLVEDRANDFSQELFVAPVSRYTILIGKIVGETLVSMIQGSAIVAFALVMGVNMSIDQLISLIPIAVAAAFLGGSFGILIMANLGSERTANQIFPFIIFPQIFLSGVFSPIKELPGLLLLVSRIIPMTYAVDLSRSIFYSGQPEYDQVVLFGPGTDLLVMAVYFLIFISVGTYLFVKNEKNK